MDGVVRKVNARMLSRRVTLVNPDDKEWKLNQVLLADDMAFVADSEEKLLLAGVNFRANENKSKVTKCTSGFGGRRMNVALNGEVLEKVVCIEYFGSKITVDGGIETEMKSRINEVEKVLGGIKDVFSCLGTTVLGKNVCNAVSIMKLDFYGLCEKL